MKTLDEITEKVLSENLLTESEQQALADAVQLNGPDCPEMKKLYEVYGCIVEAVAQEYIHNDISYDELLAAARKGFENAVNRYHSPVPLAHFVVWDIRRFIHEAMASKVVAKKSK
jgi:DNA-directed RNA polymerase sigma subunit (sigma70/sigma32)